jgi:trehalose 6-phosphate synthase
MSLLCTVTLPGVTTRASGPTTDLPVVVLSNRGPVSFRREGSERVAQRGAGGLVTALVGLGGFLDDVVWVCGAATEEDAAVADDHDGGTLAVAMGAQPRLLGDDESADEDPRLDVRFVRTPPDAYQDFYSVFSNPVLWFVQHGLYALATSPEFTRREHDAFEDGYARVNEIFADAVVEEVRKRDGRALVLVQDYHFYLVADRIREQCPDVVVSHFVHIPWPGPDGWAVLPADIREQLLRGLLGADVVAFHTCGFARNFLLCCQELLGLSVDLDAGLAHLEDGRVVHAASYPISIDVDALTAMADSDEVEQHRTVIERQLLSEDRQLIVRVDRTDPSKNIVRGFHAFGQLLEDHPELVGRVGFLAMLQPSRLDVPEYADYLGRIGSAVAEINARYVHTGREPIDLRFQENLPFAVAAYSLCDVLLVNAVADGMNLVVKETSVVNRRDAVLVLSEKTGAFEELGDSAVTAFPFDVQQQADALYEALTMDTAERRRRLAAARDVVRANDVRNWLESQFRDLHEWTAGRV